MIKTEKKQRTGSRGGTGGRPQSSLRREFIPIKIDPHGDIKLKNVAGYECPHCHKRIFSINEHALKSHVRDANCPFTQATKERVLSWYAKKAKSTRLARRLLRDCSYVNHPSEILTQNPIIPSVSVPQQPLTRNIYHTHITDNSQWYTSNNNSKQDNHSISLHELNKHSKNVTVSAPQIAQNSNGSNDVIYLKKMCDKLWGKVIYKRYLPFNLGSDPDFIQWQRAVKDLILITKTAPKCPDRRLLSSRLSSANEELLCIIRDFAAKAGVIQVFQDETTKQRANRMCYLIGIKGAIFCLKIELTLIGERCARELYRRHNDVMFNLMDKPDNNNNNSNNLRGIVYKCHMRDNTSKMIKLSKLIGEEYDCITAGCIGHAAANCGKVLATASFGGVLFQDTFSTMDLMLHYIFETDAEKIMKEKMGLSPGQKLGRPHSSNTLQFLTRKLKLNWFLKKKKYLIETAQDIRIKKWLNETDRTKVAEGADFWHSIQITSEYFKPFEISINTMLNDQCYFSDGLFAYYRVCGFYKSVLLKAYVDGDKEWIHRILNDGNYVGPQIHYKNINLNKSIDDDIKSIDDDIKSIDDDEIKEDDLCNDSDSDKTMHFSDYSDTEQPFALSLPSLNIDKYSSTKPSTKTVKLDDIVRIYFDPNSSDIEIEVNGFLWRRNVHIHLKDMIKVHDKFIANWNHCYVKEMAVAALCDPRLNITLTHHHRLDADDVLTAELGSSYINVLNQMRMRAGVFNNELFDLPNDPLRGYKMLQTISIESVRRFADYVHDILILQPSNLKMECFIRQFSLSVNHLREHLRHDTIDQLVQYKHNLTALRQLNMI